MNFWRIGSVFVLLTLALSFSYFTILTLPKEHGLSFPNLRDHQTHQQSLLLGEIQQLQTFVSAGVGHEAQAKEIEKFQNQVIERLKVLEEKVKSSPSQEEKEDESYVGTKRKLNSHGVLMGPGLNPHLQKRGEENSSSDAIYKPAEFCYFGVFPTSKQARTQSMKEHRTRAGAETEILNQQDRTTFVRSNSKRPATRAVFPVIEGVISLMTENLKDNSLAALFHNCFPNTLDTTVRMYRPSVKKGKGGGGKVDDIGRPYDQKPYTYIITGDINAMWLRDSTNQVWPYLPFMKYDAVLEDLLIGVLNLQTKMILTDPYANAFTLRTSGSDDEFPFTVGIWERKWELDSLASWLRLSYGLSEHLTANGQNPSFLFDSDWQGALHNVLGVVSEMKDISKYRNHVYYWSAANTSPFELLYQGQGFPANQTDLIKSAFRPSDDASYMAFPIPANAMFQQSLISVLKYIEKDLLPVKLLQSVKQLVVSLKIALNRHSTVFHRCFGTVYAFEVDGFGNSYMMDDANIPSLLSLPYLGYVSLDDQVYMRTRELVLSEFNPFFYRGSRGQGIGSPHAWGPHWIWPLSIIMQAMTSTDRDEIQYCLNLLKTTHGGLFVMHESFHRDDDSRFTRGWFAWANTIFGEMLINVGRRYPDLVFRNNQTVLSEAKIREKIPQTTANYLVRTNLV